LGPLSSGQWLPPVRFRLARDPLGGDDVVLPLTLGTGAASTRHELHIYTLTDQQQPNPQIANYPRAYIEDECLLPEGVAVGGGGWWGRARAGRETRPGPPPPGSGPTQGAPPPAPPARLSPPTSPPPSRWAGICRPRRRDCPASGRARSRWASTRT